MNYRNRWLLLLATLATLSVLLLAVAQAPGRVYMPVVVKRWYVPLTPRPTSMPTPTRTPTPTPTPTSLPIYMVTFAENISVTSINGTEPGCQVGNGCALFLIQVMNVGNRPARYWLTKEQTVPIGWGVFFCWDGDCIFGNHPPSRVLTVGQRETLSMNFRVPSFLVNGDVATVDVRGYYSCDGCPTPVVQQPYTNQFSVLVILPTATPNTLTPTFTPTITPSVTSTPSVTLTPSPTITATPTSPSG